MFQPIKIYTYRFKIKMISALALAIIGIGWVNALGVLAQDDVGAETSPSTPILNDIFTTNNEILFTLLAAAAIPWVVGFIVQQQWSPLYKQAAAFLVCVAAAAGYLVYKDQTVLAWDGLPRLFVLVAAVAYGFYRMYFKPVHALEAKTTLVK